MAQIICLANSKKEGERCIAGIDLATSEWVRPISKRKDKAITWDIRAVDNKEPKILDILKVPLTEICFDEGFQRENRLISSGRWKKINSIKPDDLTDYIEDDSVILHNNLDYIPFRYFSIIPQRGWKSLQLLHTNNAHFYCESGGEKPKWRVKFSYKYDARNIDLKLTDPEAIRKLNSGQIFGNKCIFTISLGRPWRPNKVTELRCYKLIAGVIEL